MIYILLYMCVRRKYNRRTIIRVRLWPTLLIHAVGPWFTVILMGLTSQPTCPRVLARRVPVQTSNKRHHTRSAHCDSVQTSHNRHHTRSAHRDSVHVWGLYIASSFLSGHLYALFVYICLCGLVYLCVCVWFCTCVRALSCVFFLVGAPLRSHCAHLFVRVGL